MAARFLIVAVVLTVFGCRHKSSQHYHTVLLDGHIETRLPDGMWPQQDMHPVAGGQYADAEHGHYLLLLFDPLAHVRRFHLPLNLAAYHYYMCENVISCTDTGFVDTVRWVFAGQWKGIESMIRAWPDTVRAGEVNWRISSFLGKRGYYHLIQWFTHGFGAEESQTSDSIILNLHERLDTIH